MARLDRTPYLWLLLITLAGAALRLAALGQAPPGLYHDEAFNGLDALNVLAGQRPIYFEANHGREPLYIYLVALSVGALGPEPYAVRLPAALLGTLTIPAAYAMARAWFPARRTLPLLTAALVAFTFWPLHLSRIGFRAVALPLVAALMLAALGRWIHPGHSTRGYRWPALAGALLGLSAYTYLAARLLPAALALFGVWAWWAHRMSPRDPGSGSPAGFARAAGRELLVFLAAAALVAAPLAAYAAQHPDVVFARTEQVSVFSPEINGGDLPGALVRHTLAGLGMFFVRGDAIPRHNLPGRAVFDPLMGAFFAIGVLWCLARARREPGAALALIWTAVLIVPTVLAEDTPHFLRAAGVLPVVCMLPAAGLDAAAEWAGSVRWPLRRAAMIVIVAASALLTAWDYFGVYATLPKVATEFESAAVALAREARAFPGDVYISARLWRDFESIPFMLSREPVSGSTARVHVVERPGEVAPAGDALVLVWPHDPADPPSGYVARLPVGRVLSARVGPEAQGDLEPKAYSLYLALAAQGQPPTATGTQFANGPRLLEARLQADGPETLRVILVWYAPEPIGADYTVYVHALAGGAQIAGADAPPGEGYLPTAAWRPGEVVRDEHVLALPSSYDPARVTVRVGLYGADGARLSALNASGAPADDGVTVGFAP